MAVERYNEKFHYDMIAAWYMERQMTPITREMLPKVGYVVIGCAAGFLYQTDSKMTLIENLITNPHSTKRDRNTGLDEVVKAILEQAGSMGYSLVVGFSQIDAIINRALKLGFSEGDKQFRLVSKGVGPWAL